MLVKIPPTLMTQAACTHHNYMLQGGSFWVGLFAVFTPFKVDGLLPEFLRILPALKAIVLNSMCTFVNPRWVYLPIYPKYKTTAVRTTPMHTPSTFCRFVALLTGMHRVPF